MDAKRKSKASGANRTTIQRKSEREMVVTRTFNAPARIVYEAWTNPKLLMQWWTPKSMPMTFLSCETDVRVGGSYRFVFAHPQAPGPIAFFGKYIEVVPYSRLVSTNEESDAGAITTVTFEEKDGKTLLVWSELHPSKEALDANAGQEVAMQETFVQLDELLLTLDAGAGRS